MSKQTTEVQLLVEASTEILEFVTDPGEPPNHNMSVPAIYTMPESPMQRARREADRLERQSRAVRSLKAALAVFADEVDR